MIHATGGRAACKHEQWIVIDISRAERYIQERGQSCPLSLESFVRALQRLYIQAISKVVEIPVKRVSVFKTSCTSSGIGATPVISRSSHFLREIAL